MIGKLLGFLFGMFGGTGETRTAGIVNGLTFYGAVIAALAWFLGAPGKEWSITLNAQELAGVVAIASILIEKVRQMPPPAV